MKILLLGKNGQVGWELQRSLATLGTVWSMGRKEADLVDPDALVSTVRAVAPDVIVNAAAYTDVDHAECDFALARIVNASAVAALAREAAHSGGWLIHFSSDYVFDGSGQTPWREDAPTGPLNAYGRTKLEGEHAIRDSGCAHLILRTSWVHGARGRNFPRTILREASRLNSLQVVNDQFGAPTGAELLADVCAHALRQALARPAVGGTYHVAASGATDWHAYARHVVDRAWQAGWALQLRSENLDSVKTADCSGKAPRPLNGRLDTSKFRRAFGLRLPDWQMGVDRTLDELFAKRRELADSCADGRDSH